MKILLLNLKAQYATIKDEINAAGADVFASQVFINGPHVTALEQEIARYCGCPYACGVSSGSDAQLIALMVEGIGPGDEVITTAYPFFATAGAIVRVGAVPVFVDIDPVTYTMDPQQAAAAVTPRTRAIIPVHLYGQTADMASIMSLARQTSEPPIIVIEAAAQSTLALPVYPELEADQITQVVETITAFAAG